MFDTFHHSKRAAERMARSDLASPQALRSKDVKQAAQTPGRVLMTGGAAR